MSFDSHIPLPHPGRWLVGIVSPGWGNVGIPITDMLDWSGLSYEAPPTIAFKKQLGLTLFFPTRRQKTLTLFWRSGGRKHRPYSCLEQQTIIVTEDPSWFGDPRFLTTYFPTGATTWIGAAVKFGLLARKTEKGNYPLERRVIAMVRQQTRLWARDEFVSYRPTPVPVRPQVGDLPQHPNQTMASGSV